MTIEPTGKGLMEHSEKGGHTGEEEVFAAKTNLDKRRV